MLQVRQEGAEIRERKLDGIGRLHVRQEPQHQCPNVVNWSSVQPRVLSLRLPVPICVFERVK